jgi:SAM-dependent methyltransferase
MLFDHKRLLKNKNRAKKIGQKNIIHQMACNDLDERAYELKVEEKRGIIFGGEKTDFPKTNNQIKFDCYNFFENEVASKKVEIVINVLNLHWSNNPILDFSSQMSLLKPGGTFLCCLYGINTLKELRDCFFKAEMEIDGNVSPRICPLPEIRDIGNLANNFGVENCVVDRQLLVYEYRTASDLLKALRAMGETNILFDRKKYFSRKDVFELMSEFYLKKYGIKKLRDDKLRIQSTFELIYLYCKKKK